MQPVVTSVNPLNRTAMAVRLVKRGFRPTGAAGAKPVSAGTPGHRAEAIRSAGQARPRSSVF
jgi:hypothetical protein